MITIPDEQAAEQVAQALKEAFNSLDRSAAIVRERCTEEERKAYFEKLGDILYGITFKLMEPLYWQHPNLRPADWKEFGPPMDPD